ncbi:MAG: hypothetical protein AAGI44_19685 [Pseudomonadota bacterium]
MLAVILSRMRREGQDISKQTMLELIHTVTIRPFSTDMITALLLTKNRDAALKALNLMKI